MLPVTPLPIFNDNYIWLVQAPDKPEVVIVDPGDGLAVVEYLRRQNLRATSILITHSHHDHIGGINDVLAYREVPVYGPQCRAIPQVTHPLREGDHIDLWGARASVMEVPGHLQEHLCYVVEHRGATQVFSGDVLFSCGCGRIFSGTHRELKNSVDRLKQLPAEAQIYAAHEYTLANLAFARVVEPANLALGEREAEVRALRAAQRPSLPTSIGLERRINPFLRCDQQDVVRSAAAKLSRQPADELEVFMVLRRWKDTFRV